MVHLGACQAGMFKDQDRCIDDLEWREPGAVPFLHLAGVLDGHGHTNTAVDLAASALLGRLRQGFNAVVEGGATAKELRQQYRERIVETFAAVNDEIGAARRPGERTGTTATVVSVIAHEPTRKLGAEEEATVLCACVGDSRAVLVHPDGRTVRPLSTDHTAANPSERARIKQESRRHMATSDNVRTSFLVRRQDGQGNFGPVALFKIYPADAAVRQRLTNAGIDEISVDDQIKYGISTIVTRALGDHHAARSISCEPEITEATCPVGARVVVASDGMWDVISNERAASIIRRIRDPRKAARKLVAMAEKLRLYNGRRTDDVTVTVIEVCAPSNGPSSDEISTVSESSQESFDDGPPPPPPSATNTANSTTP